MKEEKRRIQRVVFDSPVPAMLGDASVALCDLSTTGARVEHPSGFLPGGTFTFRLEWRGMTFEARTTVTRCRLGKSSHSSLLRYQCGLRFDELDPAARKTLHSLLAGEVEAALRARKRAAAAPLMMTPQTV